jgi:cell wall-associated NlpC family hydrolase
MAGISGLSVGAVVAGGVLVYAGIRGVSVPTALREVVSGSGPTPLDRGAPVGAAVANLATAGGAYSAGTALGSSVALGGISPVSGSLVAAALKYRGDHYSMARRWDPGFSDCSSFVGKAFKDIGIKPPGASVCVSYLGWSKLRKINRKQLAAGDLCVTATHMSLATGNNTAIGQQNSRENVQTGTPESIMYGVGTVTYLRYTGGA